MDTFMPVPTSSVTPKEISGNTNSDYKDHGRILRESKHCLSTVYIGNESLKYSLLMQHNEIN